MAMLKIAKLATSRPPEPAKDLGTPGRLEWIPLTKLVIDSRYQRPVGTRGEHNINQIVSKFSWAYFSPLVVTKRGENYAVIDGQHRAIAARTHGRIDKVPCLVIDADAETEALAFTIINGNVTSMMEQHLFFARVAAKDKVALEVMKACAAANVTILKMPVPRYKVGDTLAVSTLERCLKRHGIATLITALQTVTETGNGNPGFVRAPIIVGTCDILSEHPQWRDAGEALFKAIEAVGVPGLFAMAMRDHAREGGPVRVWYAKQLRTTLQQRLGRLASAQTRSAQVAAQ